MKGVTKHCHIRQQPGSNSYRLGLHEESFVLACMRLAVGGSTKLPRSVSNYDTESKYLTMGRVSQTSEGPGVQEIPTAWIAGSNSKLTRMKTGINDERVCINLQSRLFIEHIATS